MNVAHQFFEIGIFLAENRFVPVLEKLPMPVVLAVKTHYIPRKQLSHQG